MNTVFVLGSFDDLKSRHIRFLEEASRLGDVQVLLWSDDALRPLEGKDPKFAQSERLYLIEAIRYVREARIVEGTLGPDALPLSGDAGRRMWVVDEQTDTAGKRAFCRSQGVAYRVVADSDLAGFPEPRPAPTSPGRKKVVVSGCYDWFHSGHVRFFEEVSQMGDLYVVVGHDGNVRLLKGEGHPLFTQDERRYMVGAVRHVTRALVSTGHGWLDADPEIRKIKPDIYAVNEDGDKPEKREYCRTHGIQYVVLERVPKEGLARRTSTNLRGF